MKVTISLPLSLSLSLSQINKEHTRVVTQCRLIKNSSNIDRNHFLVPGRHRQVAGGGRLRLRRPHQHRGVQAQHRGQLPRGRAGRDMKNDKQVPKKM